jgi:uncharacterized repeat protein (TIGR01451 family)
MVTFFVVLAALAVLPLISTPAAAFGERVFESNTVISGTNQVTVDSTHSVAQSFVASATYQLWNLTLRLRNLGDASNSVTISIRTDSAGVPSSTNLASSSVTIASAALTNYPVPFPTRPSLTGGTRYWIVATSSAFFSGYEWHHSAADTYPNGRAMTNFGGGGWSAVSPATDLYFVTFGRETATNVSADMQQTGPRPNPGDLVTFRVYLNNTGNTAATRVWLNDTRLPGLVYVSDTASAAGSTTPWPSFTFSNLGNGARSFDVTLRVPVGTEPGTILTESFALAFVDGTGLIQTGTAQASVLVGAQSKQLYLGPRAVGASQQLNPAKPPGGTGSLFNETLRKDGSAHDFDLNPVLTRSFRALTAGTTLFLDSTTHDVRTLRINLTLTDWNGVTVIPVGYVEQSVTTNAFTDYQPFLFSFPAFDHTFPAGGRIRLTVRNMAASATDASLAMNASFAASFVDVTTTTYVRIDLIDMRDAVRSATVWSTRDTLVVQANVSDPFGSSEVAGARVNLTSPSGAVIVNYTAMALLATDPSVPSAWKLYRFALAPPLAEGTYRVRVTAAESNGVLDAADSSALVRVPSFALHETTTSGNVRSGDRFTYSIWYNNTGSGRAGRVWINDSLPGELTFISSSDPAAMSGSYNWSWTTLGYGNYRLTIDVQVRSGIPPVPYLRNFVFLNYTDEKGFSWPVKVAYADVAVSGPVISLTKSAVKAMIHARESIDYQISLQNTGDTAQTLWVNDTLPAGLTYVSDDARTNITGASVTISGRSLYFRFTNMPSLRTWTFTVTAVAGIGLVRGSILTNIVSLNYTNTNGYLLPPRLAARSVQVGAPEITSGGIWLSRTTVVPTDILAATVRFSNAGSEAARDAWVNLTFSSGLHYLNASIVPSASTSNEVRFTLGNVPLGSSSIFLNASVDSSVRDHDPLNIDGMITYTDAYRNLLPTLTITSNRAEGSLPNMTLTVSPSLTTIEAGTRIFYNIFLVNSGSGVAGDVRLSLPLPSGFSYEGDSSRNSGATLTIAGSRYTWNWTSVGPGSRSFSLELSARTTVLNGTRTTLPFHVDYNDAKGNFLSGATQYATANFVASQIAMELTSGVLELRAGDTFTYSMRLRNIGGTSAHNVWLNYLNDSHYEVVSPPPTEIQPETTPQGRNWTFTDIQPGQFRDIAVVLRIRDGTPSGIVLAAAFQAVYTNSIGNGIGYVRLDATLKVLVDPVTYVWIGLAASGLGGIMLVAIVRRYGTQIEEVFLVYKDGVLLYHLSRSLSQDKDEDVLSGMLTAVTAFVRDAFVYGEHRELHQLDFGDYRILIERGRNLYLAVVYSGKNASLIRKRVRWVLDQIERTHAKVLEKWDGDMDSVAGARDMIREYLLRTNGRAAFRMFQIAPQH